MKPSQSFPISLSVYSCEFPLVMLECLIIFGVEYAVVVIVVIADVFFFDCVSYVAYCFHFNSTTIVFLLLLKRFYCKHPPYIRPRTNKHFKNNHTVACYLCMCLLNNST